MKDDSPMRPVPFHGLRLRHAIALLVCLAVILVLAGYFSVSAGKKAAFEAVTAQGRALTETLISSAEMIIEADNEFVEIGLKRFSETISDFTAAGLPSDEKSLEGLLKAADVERVSLIKNKKVIVSASDGISPVGTADIERWLESLDIAADAEIVYEYAPVNGKRYFWGYFPYDNKSGLFLSTEWIYGQYGNEKLGLYYLLNLVGRESGVEYIMLQNLDGIVFASKKIASTKPVSDDPFLMAAGDTTAGRIIEFQDREVLETVRTFKYNEFDGLFRVGLSLYGYRKIADGMKRQVWLVVAALIVIGMIGFGVVVGFQNFDLLKANLQKADVISRSLLDSLPGPVVTVDSGLNITDINAVAREIFGVKSPGVSDYLKLFPDDPFHFRQILESRRNANFESELGNTGKRFFVTSTPLVGYDGSAMGAIAVAQDITDTRKLEQMAESRRRLSEMGALAASMAHEIRNPLNAIGITIQRMKSEIRPSHGQEEYDKFLDGLKMEIVRLNSIIEKFLTVARSARPRFEKVNIDRLITDVIAVFSDQARVRGIDLRWKPGDDLFAEIDSSSMTQALVNVLKNSLEAVDKNGRVEIRVETAGGKIRLSVADDGPGIEDVSSAAKPFYTTKDGGTGLGLATASSILADHGGELVIESSVGKGCKVDLIFPVARKEL